VRGSGHLDHPFEHRLFDSSGLVGGHLSDEVVRCTADTSGGQGKERVPQRVDSASLCTPAHSLE
jgi:hypothetical protein